VHPFLGLAVGGGNIRHVAKFDADKKCGEAGVSTCVDTLPSGPFLIGPSFGFLAELGSVLDFVFMVNSAVGAPKFTVNFDLNMGFAVRL